MVGIGDSPPSEDMEDGMTVDAGEKDVDGASVGIEDMVGDIVVDGDIVASLPAHSNDVSVGTIRYSAWLFPSDMSTCPPEAVVAFSSIFFMHAIIVGRDESALVIPNPS
jgi:hypothetical protein